MGLVGRTRKCRECGVQFQEKRQWQVFCQTSCRRRWNKRFSEICFYCGSFGNHRDHILPHCYRTIAFRRHFGNIEYVFACSECNTSLGGQLFETISERIEHVARAIYVKNKLGIGAVEWSEDEIEELGPSLKRRIKKMLSKRRIAEDRYIYAKMVALDLSAEGEGDKRAVQGPAPIADECAPRKETLRRRRGLLWGVN